MFLTIPDPERKGIFAMAHRHPRPTFGPPPPARGYRSYGPYYPPGGGHDGVFSYPPHGPEFVGYGGGHNYSHGFHGGDRQRSYDDNMYKRKRETQGNPDRGHKRPPVNVTRARDDHRSRKETGEEEHGGVWVGVGRDFVEFRQTLQRTGSLLGRSVAKGECTVRSVIYDLLNDRQNQHLTQTDVKKILMSISVSYPSPFSCCVSVVCARVSI